MKSMNNAVPGVKKYIPLAAALYWLVPLLLIVPPYLEGKADGFVGTMLYSLIYAVGTYFLVRALLFGQSFGLMARTFWGAVLCFFAGTRIASVAWIYLYFELGRNNDNRIFLLMLLGVVIFGILFFKLRQRQNWPINKWGVLLVIAYAICYTEGFLFIEFLYSIIAMAMEGFH
jgi:hypothetical protein